MENKSVFEMILSGEIDSDIIYEDEKIFAIHDINPVAKVHILIIPKKKIPTINDLSESDANLIGSMFICAKNLAKEFDIDQTGYRLLFNTNSDQIYIEDMGPGIDDPERMFDPFYTTKSVDKGEGLGLGLSISYGLVQSFGGNIIGTNTATGAQLVVTLDKWNDT